MYRTDHVVSRTRNHIPHAGEHKKGGNASFFMLKSVFHHFRAGYPPDENIYFALYCSRAGRNARLSFLPASSFLIIKC